MTGNRQPLTDGFRDIIELKWSEFVAREQSLDATNFDSIVTALIRACAKGNLRAIQVALDRLDGKVATEIQVDYPKFFTLYPRALTVADDPTIIEADENGVIALTSGIDMTGVNKLVVHSLEPEEIPTGSLRAVLERMLRDKKDIVEDILTAAKAIDGGATNCGDPSVKGVVTAGLMKMVHAGKISAVFEVFDQIDGKVADTIKLLGGDVYMTNYSSIAPAGAERNEKGIYQVTADNTTNSWAAKLETLNKRR